MFTDLNAQKVSFKALLLFYLYVTVVCFHYFIAMFAIRIIRIVILYVIQ